MQIIIYLALIALCSFVLVKSVRLFISSSTNLAHYFNLSGYTISFLLIGLATSFPEITVAITSSLEKKPILSYGNALGANIALVTLLTAIPGLMGNGISTKSILKSKDIYFAILFSVLLLALSADKNLSRSDGMLLILCYVIYTVAFIKRSSTLEHIASIFHRVNVWKEFVIFGGSLALLALAGQGIVHSAINISDTLGLKLIFIGLTITALGTNMPELAYIIKSTKDNKEDEVMGDIVGSVVVNTTLVLGIASIIHPIDITNGMVGLSTFLFLVFGLTTFLVFSRTRERIDRLEAGVLLLIYIAFLITEFTLKG